MGNTGPVLKGTFFSVSRDKKSQARLEVPDCGTPAMGTLLALTTVGMLLWLWSENLRAREHVLRTCAAACRELDVQLLDQTVALSRLSLGWVPPRGLILQRSYSFEFSTDGVDRCQGRVGLWGGRIEYVHMDYPDGSTVLAS